MAKIEDLAQKMDIHGMIIISMTTALAFVAGLFWRDAIQQFIAEVIPEGEGLIYSFGIAVFVTIIAAVIIVVLVKSKDWKNKAVNKAKAKISARKKAKKKKK
tara:strand:- start:1843 stop:2148 length:306 start_codon:yes stop_codon:yes gene_type:complete